MNTEQWMIVLFFVIAGVTFWFVDWKNKIDIKLNQLDEYKTKINETLHKIDIELALRVTRDDLKNDFLELKKELKDMISNLKNSG